MNHGVSFVHFHSAEECCGSVELVVAASRICNLKRLLRFFDRCKSPIFLFLAFSCLCPCISLFETLDSASFLSPTFSPQTSLSQKHPCLLYP